MRFTLSAASIGAAIVLCSAADAQLIVLGSQVFLHNYVNNNGLANLGTEDFEESTLGPGLFASINDPLDANTDNMWFNPGDIHQSFRIQSNTLPNGETPSPAGANGLTLISAGHLGALSDTVTHSGFRAMIPRFARLMQRICL